MQLNEFRTWPALSIQSRALCCGQILPALCNFKAHPCDKREGSGYKMPSVISTHWSFHWSAPATLCAGRQASKHYDSAPPTSSPLISVHQGASHGSFETANESNKQGGGRRMKHTPDERPPGSGARPGCCCWQKHADVWQRVFARALLTNSSSTNKRTGACLLTKCEFWDIFLFQICVERIHWKLWQTLT